MTWNSVIESLASEELDELDAQFARVTVDTQDARRAKLRDVYERQGIALVLGAGISMDAGVPSWNRLLSSLLLGAVHSKLEPGQPVTETYRPFTSVLEHCLPAEALVVAHYVKRVLSDRRGPRDQRANEAEFLSALRQELYRSAHPVPTPLLSALSTLTRGSRWDRQSGVKEVITYNFDVLFEESLAIVGCPYTSPRRDTRAKEHGVPVYHPHGIIHRQPEDDDWAILAEDDYHAEFAAPHSWSNVVQLNAFSQLRCVFVGLSMTDPNIRRLLGAARGKDEPQHFAFLRRNQSDGLRERVKHQYRWATSGRPLSDNEETLDRVLRAACRGGDAATDMTLEALGVQVIWFDRFDELPGLVASTTKST